MKERIDRIWLDKQSFSTPMKVDEEIEKSFFQSRQESNPVIKFQDALWASLNKQVTI